MSRTVPLIHERLLQTLRAVQLGPFAQFLDGEDRQQLAMARVLAGFAAITLGVSVALAALELEEVQGLGPLTSWWLLLLHSLLGLLPLVVLTRMLRRTGLSPLAASTMALFLSYPMLVLGSLIIDDLFLVGDLDGPDAGTFLFSFLNEAVEVLPAAVVVWATVAGFLFSEAATLRTGPSGAAPGTAPPVQWPACLAEVVPEKRGELIGLSADQHYLKVETTAGESYIRCSLSDAMVALESVPGLHIHRSHWVARDQVETLVEDDGVVYCVMCSGKRYPVSRRRRSLVHSALRSSGGKTSRAGPG